MAFNEIKILKNKPSFQRCMKRYENPKCTYAFILHSFPIIKILPKVSILYPFGPLMNFQTYTWDSLPFKSISHLTMVCYHQNLIKRILGLITLFFSFKSSYLDIGKSKFLSLGLFQYFSQNKNLDLTSNFFFLTNIYKFTTKAWKF